MGEQSKEEFDKWERPLVPTIRFKPVEGLHGTYFTEGSLPEVPPLQE